MSNKNISKNTMNSKNNSMDNKSKQKSILDYFNKKCPQIKRNLDQMSDNSLNKCHKNAVHDLIVIEDNDKQTNSGHCEEEVKQIDPIDREEFIDLSQFLQINFTEEDKQIGVSIDDNESNEDKKLSGYCIYQNFRQMIDFVLKDKHFCQLFDENDLNVIQVFTCLSGNTKIF